MRFSLDRYPNHMQILMLMGENPHNPTPRLPVVHLDETLTFSGRLSVFGTEGRENLTSLREVSVIERLSTKSLLQLYKAIVIPQMEFAALVLQNSSLADTLR